MPTIARSLTLTAARTIVTGTLLSLLATAGAAGPKDGPVKGQEVLFVPSAVSLSSDNQWSMTIQGRIFEPTENSRRRELFIRAIARIIGVDPQNVEQSNLFHQRARFFVSDSQRNTHVSVKIDDETIRLPASDPGGYFTSEITLTNNQVTQLANGGMISFESLPTKTNSKRFPGIAVLIPEEGVTVVTDVDDTIKITNILNRSEKVANTFLRPFVAVPGMPELYRSWKETLGPRIHFHIVSAGPWQLYPSLSRFTQDAGFPAFTWDMRSVDIGDVSVAVKELNSNPYHFKLQKIRTFMKRFPRRHVVLVGDSGEKDPEVYSKIVSEFQGRVDAVFIRNVTGEDHDAYRYKVLFPDKAADILHVFLDPQHLPLLR